MNYLFKEIFDDFFGKDFEKFQDSFDGFVDDIYKNVEVPSFVLSKGTYPKVNIVEKKDGFELIAAVPGLTKDDLEVKFDDGLLMIKGKARQDKPVEKDRFIMRELKKSHFIRSFKVNENKVDLTKIECSCENGELRVNIPKKEDGTGDDPLNFNIS